MPAQNDINKAVKAIHNPFEEQPNRMSEYTAVEIATLQSRLDRQLGPEYISTRSGPGGGKIHYLAAEKVINLANEVFGFNGWSSALQQIQVDFVDEVGGRISMGLSAVVRVTLKDGTYHEDIGYGHIENSKGKAAAFEKAKKEAATDAMKRALRNFGNVLGNCLYDKDYLARVAKVKVAPLKWDPENLHRHPDCVATKKGTVEELETAYTKNHPPRMMTDPSIMANGTSATTEYGEDDFGGNMFDESDFTHPDEVCIDATEDEVVNQNTMQESSRRTMERVVSMPDLQQQAAQQNKNTEKQLAPVLQTRPIGQSPMANKIAAQPGSGVQAVSKIPRDGLEKSEVHQITNVNNNDLTPHGEVPESVAFVNCRAAVEPGAATAFNPNAETTIRRSLANPGKSAPVRRSMLNPTNEAENDKTAPNAGHPSVPVAIPRSNFVNPASDPARRVGAPPISGVKPFKQIVPMKRLAPADTLARPPLAELTNHQPQQPTDDRADSAKKPKVEPVSIIRPDALTEAKV